MKIELYTDGGCSGNPGIGGYAYVIRLVNGDNYQSFVRSNFEDNTTNNRMELLAIINGLEEVSNSPAKDLEITITSDSSYCINPFTKGWIYKWRKNKFMKGNNPMPNRDLWLRLESVLKRVGNIEWIWVKGHNGHKFNEICDNYAVKSYRMKESYFERIEVM